MASKEYTLVRKAQVIGPTKGSYNHSRGDVINQEQYNKLIDRHKEQFEEGRVQIGKKKSKADESQDKDIKALTTRVEAIEKELGIGEAAKDDKAPEKDADSGDDKKDQKSTKKKS